MSKLKHNKKRNVLFVYEALIRELTKSFIREDKEKKEKILSILKDFFSKGKILQEEMELYKTLLETNSLNKETSEKLLNEVKRAFMFFGQEKLEDEHDELVKRVNKDIGRETYNNFVPNYKNLATIGQIFNGKISPKSRIMLEQSIVERMMAAKEENEEIKKVDNLTFKTFIEKFNTTYNQSLLKEQKALLSKYIISGENDLDLKVYLNEEIGRLKEMVQKSFENEEIKNDEDMVKKTSEVLNVLDGFAKEEMNENSIKRVMLIQQLINEVFDNVDQNNN